jgi:hypothetical protein
MTTIGRRARTGFVLALPVTVVDGCATGNGVADTHAGSGRASRG